MKTLTKTNDKNFIVDLSKTVGLWADQTTNPTSPRRFELINYKSNVVLDFFQFADILPQFVTELEVKAWQAKLEEQDLKPATIYSKMSKLSSYFSYLVKYGHLDSNPVLKASPKVPSAYQSDSLKPLGDSEVKNLLSVIKKKAKEGSLSAIRDYAILLWFLYSGMRREEIISLLYGSIEIEGADKIVFRTRVKGGEIVNRELKQKALVTALNEYLKACNHPKEDTAPLWLIFDRSGIHKGKAITSHSVARNLKKYAKEVGIKGFHIHRLRHTFSRIVGEEAGSIIILQDSLGHKNPNTTRHYLSKLGTKKDNYSEFIADRID